MRLTFTIKKDLPPMTDTFSATEPFVDNTVPVPHQGTIAVLLCNSIQKFNCNNYAITEVVVSKPVFSTFTSGLELESYAVQHNAVLDREAKNHRAVEASLKNNPDFKALLSKRYPFDDIPEEPVQEDTESAEDFGQRYVAWEQAKDEVEEFNNEQVKNRDAFRKKTLGKQFTAEAIEDYNSFINNNHCYRLSVFYVPTNSAISIIPGSNWSFSPQYIDSLVRIVSEELVAQEYQVKVTTNVMKRIVGHEGEAKSKSGKSLWYLPEYTNATGYRPDGTTPVEEPDEADTEIEAEEAEEAADEEQSPSTKFKKLF